MERVSRTDEKGGAPRLVRVEGRELLHEAVDDDEAVVIDEREPPARASVSRFVIAVAKRAFRGL